MGRECGVQALFQRSETNTITVTLRPALTIVNRMDLALEVVEPSLGPAAADVSSEGEGQQGEESVLELGPSASRFLCQNEVSLCQKSLLLVCVFVFLFVWAHSTLEPLNVDILKSGHLV